MKKISLLAMIILMAATLHAQKKVQLNSWLKAGPVKVHKPAFYEVKNINGEKYQTADMLEHIQIELAQPPSLAKKIQIMGKNLTWEKPVMDDDTLSLTGLSGNNVVYLTTYLKMDQWAKVQFTFTSDALFEVYIDGKKKHTKKKEGRSNEVFTADLHEGNHQVSLKMLGTGERMLLAGKVTVDEAFQELSMANTLESTRALNIYDILNGRDRKSVV